MKFKRSLVVILFILVLVTGYYAYSLREKYITTVNNNYNRAFTEAVNHINNIENFLAKTQITKNPEYSAENLTEIWNDANMAMVYLSEIPFDSEGNAKTIKFLNQVSDYSYLLAKKNLSSEELSDEDFENLSKLYDYSKELELVLNQLSEEIYSGNLNWNELKNNTKTVLAQEVGNIDVFSSIDSTFNDYEGLIYDGAFSEHLNRNEKKAFKGNEITKEEAEDKIKDYIFDNIEKIDYRGFLENVDIQVYTFDVYIKNSELKYYIEITKVGGYLYQLNNSKEISEEKISQEDANRMGIEYLNKIGFENMKETYFTKRENIVTVNYAYNQNGIICYPDLIKVKIALDDGKILGIETKGYLNCHYERKINTPKISKEDAKKNINTKLEILGESEAIIPNDDGKEIYCYEYKGKVEDKEFLVYVNVETGKEENILMILDTPGGTLTI